MSPLLESMFPGKAIKAEDAYELGLVLGILSSEDERRPEIDALIAAGNFREVRQHIRNLLRAFISHVESGAPPEPARRYEVRAVNPQFGDLMLATDDEAEAKEFARDHRQRFLYELAIIDTETKIAEIGDRIVPLADAARAD